MRSLAPLTLVVWVSGLKQLNYRGAVTIEREISGPQQVADVREAKNYLEKLIG